MPKPRFLLVVKFQTPFACGERQFEFYTLAGAEQWLDNARATGEVGAEDKVSVYDDSGVKL